MNKKTLLTRGFTLIELLVVIAIIGILAAVVIGSLNDARSGGQNASVQQSMSNIRSQAELVYNSAGYSYTGICSNGRITNLINASLDVVNGTNYATTTHGVASYVATNGAAAANRTANCHADDTRYAVSAPLAANNFWCVDSTGFSGQIGATSTSALGNADYTCQ